MRRVCLFSAASDLLQPLADHVAKPRQWAQDALPDLFRAQCDGCAAAVNGKALVISSTMRLTTGQSSFAACPKCGSHRFVATILDLDADERRNLLEDPRFSVLFDPGEETMEQ